MFHITKQETYNTGGGCMVDILHLSNGRIIAVSDEYVGLYNSVDDMLEDDGTKCLNGFWIDEVKACVPSVDIQTKLKEFFESQDPAKLVEALRCS